MHKRWRWCLSWSLGPPSSQHSWLSALLFPHYCALTQINLIWLIQLIKLCPTEMWVYNSQPHREREVRGTVFSVIFLHIYFDLLKRADEESLSKALQDPRSPGTRVGNLGRVYMRSAILLLWNVFMLIRNNVVHVRVCSVPQSPGCF